MKQLSSHKKVIRYIWQRRGWPRLTWRMETLAGSLGKTRFLQGQLLSKIRSFGFDRSNEARAEILIEEAVKTSAVEGNSLNIASVRSSVARHLGLPTAGLPSPERYIDGLVDVLLDATTHYDEELTGKRIKGWQAALFPTGYSGMHEIRVGRWRGVEPMGVISGPLGKERTHYEAPPHNCIDQEMRTFLKWWKESRKMLDGLIRAGAAHFYFVTIHPFEDGNGRIARAITDMALAQDEKSAPRFYSLSSQILAERDAYYDILESSQKGDLDITEWLLWFLDCAGHSMEKSEKILNILITKAEFWRKNANLVIFERQRKVINKLLDAGQGGFEGGLTTRKYVSMTKASRATAYREITDLVEKGLLRQNEGQGRNVSYDLVWE